MMESAQKFFLIPNDKIGRMEAIKQLESQPLLEHAKRLEKSKEDTLGKGNQIPADQLLKYYADTLYKYQQFIENLKLEQPSKPAPPPKTPPPAKKEDTFSTPVAGEHEMPVTPPQGSPLDSILGQLPTGRREKGKFFYNILQNDDSLKIEDEVVYFTDGRKVDTVSNIVENMARNLRYSQL